MDQMKASEERPKRKLALVTGASSGVGVEFSRLLAERGYDLLLSARRLERLQQTADEIKEQHAVAVEIIPCDLGIIGGAEELMDALGDREIDFAVNNAGLGVYRPLTEHSVEEIDNMINVNLRSLTILTRGIARQMVERGRGRILNHASFAGIHPSPWYSVYSATKAYVVDFSNVVNFELRDSGVSVTALCPCFFRSEFQDKSGRKPGSLGKSVIMEPDYIARIGIEAALKGKSTVIPAFKYKFLNLLIRLFPRSLTMKAANWFVHN